MIIPSKINIAGHDVDVDVEPMALDSDMEQNMGLAHKIQDKIRIAQNCKGVGVSIDNQGETFLHEIIHIVADKWDTRVSEKQVTVLATGLYQVLKDNKLKFFDEE